MEEEKLTSSSTSILYPPVIFLDSQHSMGDVSVAMTRAGVFANLWNKIGKILEIFPEFYLFYSISYQKPQLESQQH
jgi:hypothetical protein